MQSRTNYQPCARCPEEAIVGLDSEWLCAGCFDAALAAKREEIEAIILSFEEPGVSRLVRYADDSTMEIHLLPPAPFGTMQIFEFPEVDEIESPLLCGSDD